MSSWSLLRRLTACLVLCALFVLSSPAVRTQRVSNSADERLRALYTEEWNWRRKELGRTAALPLVIDTGIHQFGWSREQANGVAADARRALRARDHD